jgi:hypothetical protein
MRGVALEGATSFVHLKVGASGGFNALHDTINSVKMMENTLYILSLRVGKLIGKIIHPTKKKKRNVGCAFCSRVPRPGKRTLEWVCLANGLARTRTIRCIDPGSDEQNSCSPPTGPDVCTICDAINSVEDDSAPKLARNFHSTKQTRK